MTPGDLKERIEITDPAYTDGDYGDPVLKPPSEWTTVATVWAAYRDLSGREFFSARQTNAELTGEFKIHYRTGIKPSHKIIWGERVFDIDGPPRDIDGKRQWLYINVKEVV